MHQDRLLKGRNFSFFLFYPLFYPFPPIFRPFSASGRQESRERGQKSRGKREKIEKNRGRWGSFQAWARTWQVTDFLQRVLVAVAKQRPQRPLQFAAAAFLKRSKMVDPVLACEKPETTGCGASVFPVQPLASLCRTRIS